MKPVKHGLYIAMAEEARVVAKHLNFVQCKKDVWPFSEAFFHEGYSALIVTGGQADFDGRKISRVGKAAAAQMTALLIERHHPQWLWNVGTCGGIAEAGAQIGDVFTGQVQQHDMHTPQDLLKRFVQRRFFVFVPKYLVHNNVKVGVISTGGLPDWLSQRKRQIRSTQKGAISIE